jgi:hypothetical protein
VEKPIEDVTERPWEKRRNNSALAGNRRTQMSEMRAVYRLFAAEVIAVDGDVAVALCIDPLTKEKQATVSFNNFDELTKSEYVHVAQFDDGTFGVAGCAVTNPLPSSNDYAAVTTTRMSAS